MPNDDYIKRSDVLKIECGLCIATCRKRDHQCIKAIMLNNLPAADVEPKRKWIPVTERLPEEDGNYLVYVLDGECGESFYYIIPFDAAVPAFGCWRDQYDPETYGWAGSDFFPFGGVTHWMPLPEPPKEEEDA